MMREIELSIIDLYECREKGISGKVSFFGLEIVCIDVSPRYPWIGDKKLLSFDVRVENHSVEFGTILSLTRFISLWQMVIMANNFVYNDKLLLDTYKDKMFCSFCGMYGTHEC